MRMASTFWPDMGDLAGLARRAAGSGCHDRRVVAFDAMVLAGGAARRLHGADKASVEIGRRTMLDRALDAVAEAVTTVVVGPDRPVPPGVRTVIEDPPGGGPVAAIAAGMGLVTQPLVVVLACDMPLVTRVNVRLLVDVLGGVEADAVMFAADGYRQPLAAAYRATALTSALRALGEPNGESVRHLVGPLTVHEIAADPETTADCDTWADVARTRELLEDR